MHAKDPGNRPRRAPGARPRPRPAKTIEELAARTHSSETEIFAEIDELLRNQEQLVGVVENLQHKLGRGLAILEHGAQERAAIPRCEDDLGCRLE